MTDKERLKEFKKQIEFLDDSADMDDFGRFVDTLQNMYEDGEFHWIIRYLKEQAERVQELEETVEDYKTVNKELHQRGRKVRKQNKRYQEALEEIARGRFPGASYKARKALEGEE